MTHAAFWIAWVYGWLAIAGVATLVTTDLKGIFP